MEKQKIDMFKLTNKKKFTPLQMKAIEESLKTLPDDKAVSLMIEPPFRNPSSMLTIAIFLGPLGVDRFMLGEVGFGFAKLLSTFFLMGAWWIIDMFSVKKRTYEYNIKKFNEIIMY